ncbi:MAG: hypothetical protein Ct9H300mP13_3330 [Gammaproteobacteria bacterium]|nr:MAG: hypothetical protein Ct9H300mP13_3330 [Gammaproteobacteria bacterium]
MLYVPEKLVIKYGGHKDQLSGRRGAWIVTAFRRLKNCSYQKGYQNAVPRDRRRMVRKIDIYVAGARRRERWQEVQRYTPKRTTMRAHRGASRLGSAVREWSVVMFLVVALRRKLSR